MRKNLTRHVLLIVLLTLGISGFLGEDPWVLSGRAFRAHPKLDTALTVLVQSIDSAPDLVTTITAKGS